MNDDETQTAVSRKWRLGSAFLWGAGIGVLISVASLVNGGDPLRSTTNRAQEAGASLAPFIMPLLFGGIGVIIAALRNLFVK